jgi:predicted transcriptional regulator
MEIYAEILEICKKPRTITSIRTNAYLCWQGVNNYLSDMMSFGFLTRIPSDSRYITTQKGSKFLSKLIELDKMLKNS